MWLMTKLDDNCYMTEDGFLIEVMELSADLLVWAAPRDGNYDSPCELLVIGAVRNEPDEPPNEWGMQTLWLDEVCRAYNPDHPLCISTTERFRRQLSEIEQSEALSAIMSAVAERSRDEWSEKVEWQAEGF